MAQTVKLEISKDLFDIIQKLAKKQNKKPEQYFSDLIKNQIK